jgi:hypothetical protein
LEIAFFFARGFMMLGHYCPVDDAVFVGKRLIRLSLRAILGGVDLNWV